MTRYVNLIDEAWHLQRLNEEAPNVKSRVKRQSELTGITTVRSIGEIPIR